MPFRLLLLAVLFFASAVHASATSVRDFEALSSKQQGRFLADYVDRMATDISAKNPPLGRAIVEYFSVAAAGKASAPGIQDLMIEVAKVQTLARHGKADLAKLQIENMIVYVVKKRFSEPSGVD